MKKNEEKTNVIRILEQNKINFKVYNYIIVLRSVVLK